MSNEFTFLMLPPQTELTRQWARRLADSVPGMNLVVAEDAADRRRAPSSTADAAFGTLPPELLAKAQRLRWLQAPQAAPPAGYYYPELIAHPAGGHQLPRDLQRPHQRPHPGLRPGLRARAARLHPAAASPRMEEAARGQGRGPAARVDRADRRPGRDRRRDRAAAGGVRHEGARDGCPADRQAGGRGGTAPARGAGLPAAAGRFRHPDGAAHAGHRGVLQSRANSGG